MIFITLSKVVRPVIKKDWLDQVNKLSEKLLRSNIKILGNYWTLGRFDGVTIFEAPTEKDAMKFAVEVAKLGISTTETLVAIPREEAIKLV
jgi:uncharacterized protein with GYD domain